MRVSSNKEEVARELVSQLNIIIALIFIILILILMTIIAIIRRRLSMPAIVMLTGGCC
jgi:hypothetical protein